ncbi:DUF4232 domain-containing protein [Actinomadura opuntiae]|uniref:DUF4232 domain-containing protein n=1 Tax=Actinomadura sp. OS1-43 TaxID=604315 RepID=UPI00255ADF66|nr:DUF4232 domain-containing protein [Actinomadura sp. OS1-43]MDL4818405.1 DUF4232 domain-containing protein [Actinomadura sp. OS1-43]
MDGTSGGLWRLAVAAGALAAVLGAAACGSEAGGASGVPPVPGTATSRPSPLPSVRSPTPAPRTPCSADGVSLSMDVPDAAMGLRAAAVDLHNCGTRPYRLNGYPALRILDKDRQPFDVRPVNGTREVKDPGPKPLTVAPGASARIVIVWRNLVTESTTVAVNGSYLEVRPAPGRPVVVLPSNGPLDLGNTGRLETTAWTAVRR